MKTSLLFLIILLFFCVPFAHSHEGANDGGQKTAQGIANGALEAYDEIMRVLRDGFKQIREGKKEITLYLNLDDNPKTKEKIVISPESLHQLGELIKKQVDQSVNEIQKNVQP